MEELQIFIDGRKVAGAGQRRTQVINPATGETFATAPVCGADDVSAGFASASAALEVWRNTTPAERSLALLRIADAIEARADELTAVESQNTGMPLTPDYDDIPGMVDQIRFFAAAARMLEGRSAGEYLAGFTSWIRREPIGVCAAGTPGNYPMSMAAWKGGPACTAAARVLASPDVYGDLAEALAEQAGAQRIGSPDADFGPLNNAAQLERVSGLIERLPGHAQVVAGGTRAGSRGYFYEATVVAALQQRDEIVQSEIFGPVITLQRFSDEGEAGGRADAN